MITYFLIVVPILLILLGFAIGWESCLKFNKLHNNKLDDVERKLKEFSTKLNEIRRRN